MVYVDMMLYLHAHSRAQFELGHGKLVLSQASRYRAERLTRIIYPVL